MTSQVEQAGDARGTRGGVVAAWRRVHGWSWWGRWLVKGGLVAVTCALALYPKVWLIPTWVGRLRNLNGVLDPECPGLADLEADVRAGVGDEATPEAVRKAVEATVRTRIPYAFDWETWGVMDYLPTVAEALELGREDCDGRAVVAASLLRRMGQEAWLASDLKHVWVVTPEGELMSPGKGAKAMVGGESGTKTAVSWATLASLGRAATFGVAVFPVGRELLMLAALCVAAMQPNSQRWRRVAGCLVLLVALIVLRAAGASAEALAAQPVFVWVGLAAALAGWLLLVVGVRPRGGG